ncbi:MAG: ECF transporter S component [Candidatus Bathyarchaeia archaeon]
MGFLPLSKKIVTLTFIATFLITCRFSIFTLNSLGLFTFSEPLFFLSALLLGSIHGALTGGIGFALSGFLLGYPHYILAALIVNSATGFIIGKINQLKYTQRPLLSAISTFILISSLTVAGLTIYSGVAYIAYTEKLFLGEDVMRFGGIYAYRLYIPQWFWIVVSTLISFISFFAFKKFVSHSMAGCSLLVGCLTLILGYFLYETFIMPTFFHIKVDATTNLIINFGHSVISANFSLLLYWSIKKLKENAFHGI